MTDEGVLMCPLCGARTTPHPCPGGYPAGEEGVIDLGLRHFVRPGEPCLWWHDGPAAQHVSWRWFGVAKDGRASGHRIERMDPLTVGGSLICTDCGDHGFIRNGRWEPA